MGNFVVEIKVNLIFLSLSVININDLTMEVMLKKKLFYFFNYKTIFQNNF